AGHDVEELVHHVMAMERPGTLARRHDGQRATQLLQPEHRPRPAGLGLKGLALPAVLHREVGDVDDALWPAHRAARRAVGRRGERRVVVLAFFPPMAAESPLLPR